MDTALLIAALWLGFGASHIALASLRFRPRLVAALGESGYLGLYSAIALAIFVPLVWVYFANKHAGPYVGSLATLPGMRWIMYTGMGVALCLALGGLVRQSPASIARGGTEVRGVFHLTRHPLLMGLALFGLLHLTMVAVHAAELAFFAGFPLFVLAGCRHQDQRKLATAGEGFRRFHAQTSFLPAPHPRALVAAVREQPVVIVAAIGLAVVLRRYHPNLFGP